MTARPHDDDEPDPVEPGAVDLPAGGGPGGGPGAASGADPHDPTPTPDDVEARWLEIVARLEVSGERRDVAADAVGPTGQPSTGTPDHARVIRPAAPTGPRAWAPDPAVEEAEDHFEPPDPGPVLSGDPLLTMAWAAVIGMPALLLVAVIAWRDIPTLLLEGAGVTFLGAVGLLLWRMPRHRDDDGGPGAVV